MIVLDTTVVSELMRKVPEPSVVTWTAQRAADQIFITAVTAAELLYGAARLPTGRRRQLLLTRVAEMIDDDFGDRVFPFDTGAVPHYAQICADREGGGRPISAADAQIAAVCRSRGAPLATRNTRDFDGTGIDVVNPWSRS